MAGLCKAIVVGNLGRDPDKRYTQDGRPVTTFRVAATTRKRERDGEWQDHTEWFGVTVFGRQAETLAERLTKGSRVFVEGRLETRTYDGRDGRGFALDIIASDVLILDSRQRAEADFGGAEAGDEAQGHPGDAGASPGAPQGARSFGRGQQPQPDDNGELEDLPF
jgi:single-strand DNA-binding protein